MPNWITVAQGVSGAGWLAMLVIVWKAGVKVGEIESRLNELASNHLPHLELEIRELRADLREFASRVP
ncbi:MAG: hypothetical protein ACREKE_07875 [bacterium]